MNAVEGKVLELVEMELAAANEKHPPFASQHEGYAVIKEEIEEAGDKINSLEQHFEYAWDTIKNDANAKERVEICKHFAVLAACELIQVAAMCEKFQKNVLFDTRNHAEQCIEEFRDGLTWYFTECRDRMDGEDKK